MLKDKLEMHTNIINSFYTSEADRLEQFRVDYLGTKGIIKQLFDEFKALPPEEKRDFGKPLNELRLLAEETYDYLKSNPTLIADDFNRLNELTLAELTSLLDEKLSPLYGGLGQISTALDSMSNTLTEVNDIIRCITFKLEK